MKQLVKPILVLFVCKGNICRSPLAEAIFRHETVRLGLHHRLAVASRATHSSQVGNPADVRAKHVATVHGLDLSKHAAKMLEKSDLKNFAYIFAMDQKNLNLLESMADEEDRPKIHLLSLFAGSGPQELIDPYKGSLTDFFKTYDQLSSLIPSLLKRIATQQ